MSSEALDTPTRSWYTVCALATFKKVIWRPNHDLQPIWCFLQLLGSQPPLVWQKQLCFGRPSTPSSTRWVSGDARFGRRDEENESPQIVNIVENVSGSNFMTNASCLPFKCAKFPLMKVFTPPNLGQTEPAITRALTGATLFPSDLAETSYVLQQGETRLRETFPVVVLLLSSLPRPLSPCQPACPSSFCSS